MCGGHRHDNTGGSAGSVVLEPVTYDGIWHHLPMMACLSAANRFKQARGDLPLNDDRICCGRVRIETGHDAVYPWLCAVLRRDVQAPRRFAAVGAVAQPSSF